MKITMEQIIRKKHDIFKVICKFALMPGKIKLIPIGTSPKKHVCDREIVFNIYISRSTFLDIRYYSKCLVNDRHET